VGSVREKGFTLFELLIVLAIVTVIAAIAVPTVMRNIPRYKLKAAARTLVDDFQRAKIEAVKRNCDVQIQFTPASYTPAGGAGSYKIVDTSNPSPPLLSRKMPQYVTLYSSSFGGTTGYTSQGLPIGGLGGCGSVFLRNNQSTYYRLALSIAGNVSLSMSSTGSF